MEMKPGVYDLEKTSSTYAPFLRPYALVSRNYYIL